MAKILIAEDNNLDAIIVERILTQAGHDVKRAVDGLTAYDAFRAETFDLLLTDVLMPGISGIELIQRLRVEGQKIRALVMTASQEDEVMMRSFHSGALDHVQKPLHPHLLLAKIQLSLRQEPL